MEKRSVILVVVVFLILACLIVAQEGAGAEQRLCGLFFMPTAYTLNGGEWMVGIGPVSCGITHNLMVGTNVLLDALTILNVNGKLNLLRLASGTDLAITASFATAGVLWGFSLPNLYIGGGVALSQALSSQWRVHLHSTLTPGTFGSVSTSLTAGTDLSLSRNAKMLGEFSFADNSLLWVTGMAFRWGAFHLKIGALGLLPSVYNIPFLPWVDLYWRF